MKPLLALLLMATVLLISGCETFHGLGRDVEKAGQWVQDKAQ